MSFIKGSINFLDLNFHYFGYTDILDTYERGVFYQRGDLPITVKLQRTLQSNQISSLDLPHTCRESTMNKVSIQIICLTLFLLSRHKYGFFVSVTLVSFILKCYPLFCINFFYLKVVFDQIRLNLTCANFQYTIFFSIRIYKGCALRKIEGSPVLWTCEIHCAQHIISKKKQRFSSPGRAVL